MSLLHPIERLLMNLEQDVPEGYLFIHVDRDAARKELVALTGQDFGHDGSRWREWLSRNGYLPERDYYHIEPQEGEG